MPLVVGENYNYLVVEVFEAAKSLEMVVPINPAVWEAYWTDYVEIIILFMTMDSITPGINHYDILMR